MNALACKIRTLCDTFQNHHLLFSIESKFIKVDFKHIKYDHSNILVLSRYKNG